MKAAWPRSALVVATALLAAVMGTLMPGGRALADPSGTVAVSPTTGTSPRDQQIDFLAGSPTYLIYALVPVAATGSAPGQVQQEYADSVVDAVDPSGVVRTLGLSASNGWSVEGDMVTAQPAQEPLTVDWQRLSTGESGTASLPAGAKYLGATPEGWAFLLAQGVWTQTPSSPPAYLGAPLTGVYETVGAGAVGPDGVLVGDANGKLGYIRYDDPSHPVVLQSSFIGSPSCSVLSEIAVCQVYWSDGDTNHLGLERVSLTGGPSVSFGDRPERLAVDETTTAGADVNTNVTTLYPANGSKPVELPYAADLMSAFGKIAMTNASGTAIDVISAATDTPQQLVAPTRSPIRATSFAATSGRVVWADDQASGSDPNDSGIDTWSRAVGNEGGNVVTGSPSLLSAIGSPVSLTASAASTMYATVTDSDRILRHVVTPVAVSTVRQPVNDGSDLQLSGNRVLDGQRLTNVATGKSHTVLAGTKFGSAIALWGNYLGYIKADGSVWRRNLVTHHEVRLVKPATDTRKVEGPVGSVFLYGDHVAWQYNYRDRSHGNEHHVDGYVDVRHPSAVTGLPHGFAVTAATSDGLVISTGYAASFELLGYQKGAVPVPVPLVGPIDSVAVDSSVMTWLDDGVVRSAPLPIVPDQPRALGAPIAPASLLQALDSVWAAYFPYSAALTSCSLTITRGSTVLRVLACDARAMTSGGAVVIWDGQNAAGHTVKSGKVTWRLTAANADGPALAPNGALHPLTGTIQVRD
ncbi:MAG TPA: hypothetical protein VHV76_06625 [Mycobacteriales bacterium]|nr:hypothetical protein [Mycobacteriales bacterium]